jgi:hypothetical protein
MSAASRRVYHPYEPEYLAALKKARVKEIKSRAFAKDFATYLVFLVAITIVSQENRSSWSFSLKDQVERSFVTNLGLDMVGIVRYHSGGSMKLNACILHLAYMVYL